MKMHRLAAASVAAFAIALTAATPAHAQLGIGAGANFNDLDDIELGDADATFDESTGYHFGLFYNFGSGTVSLRPGVFYHQIGTYDFPDDGELELSAVEVPIDLLVNLTPGGVVSVYLIGAPVVTFPTSGDEGFEEAFNDFALSADVGVGLSLEVTDGLTLMPELRYGAGLTDYWSDEFEVGGVTVSPLDDSRRLSRWMVRLNLMF